MSEPTSNSVTPKSSKSATPVLSQCSVPYRWILHVGRCLSLYFDKAQPEAIWDRQRHTTVQILFFGTGAECTVHWEENGEWFSEEVKGQHLWIIGAGIAHSLVWRREALRLVFYVEPTFARESTRLEITGSLLMNLCMISKCDVRIPHLLSDFETMDQPETQPECIHVESLSSLITVRLF